MLSILFFCTIIFLSNNDTWRWFRLRNIFSQNIKQIFESWIADVKKANIYSTKPISLIIPAKLIVFAWDYATYQTHELKTRFNSINFNTTIESIFLNKLAQITLAMHFGFLDDAIIAGKTFVGVDPSSKDERYFVDMLMYDNGKPVKITGTKKFIYPTVDKYPTSGQLFVYIDATRILSGDNIISRIAIQNNAIKATILGYVTKSDIKSHQNQSFLLDYSNKYSSFVGLNVTKPIDSLTFVHKQSIVPDYMKDLICYDNIEEKLSDIITQLKSNVDNTTIQTINYKDLFDPIINDLNKH
jgi:hypothetical protein